MNFDIQKAGMLKRVSAWLLDTILLVVLATGFMALIGVICDYDTHYKAWSDVYPYYSSTYSIHLDATEEEVAALPDVIQRVHAEAVKEYEAKVAENKQYYESLLGSSLDKTDEEIAAMTEEERGKYQSALNSFNLRSRQAKNDVEEAFAIRFDLTQEESQKLSAAGEDDIHYQHYMAVDKMIREDDEAQREYRLVIGFTLMITSIGILLSVLILEFVLPLIFKNGQTLGKKAFGIALMHANGVKVNNLTMFVRSILGKYTIDIMVPVLLVEMILFAGLGWIGLLVIGLLLALNLGLFFFTKTHTAIHDLLAKTVAIDLASQHIFDSEDEMIAFMRTAGLEKVADDERAETIYRKQRTDIAITSGTDEDKKDDSDA